MARAQKLYVESWVAFDFGRAWTTQRKEMFQCTNEKRGNLSFHLGGKAASDGQEWKPDMDAVRATIRFAIATGRLERG